LRIANLAGTTGDVSGVPPKWEKNTLNRKTSNCAIWPLVKFGYVSKWDVRVSKSRQMYIEWAATLRETFKSLSEFDPALPVERLPRGFALSVPPGVIYLERAECCFFGMRRWWKSGRWSQ